MTEKKTTLADYVKERTGGRRSALYSVFGGETEGNFLRWTFGFQRFEHFSGEGRHVMVHVSCPGSGVAPTCEEAQPYAWDGKINADAAESALWHAYGILTETEALEFKLRHSPEVVFEFMENFKANSLRVKFIDGDWYVVDE
jgi:hypothetical protein